jgi:hypothetical protein
MRGLRYTRDLIDIGRISLDSGRMDAPCSIAIAFAE